mgnify:CR=1 FL=1
MKAYSKIKNTYQENIIKHLKETKYNGNFLCSNTSSCFTENFYQPPWAGSKFPITIYKELRKL